MLIDTHCHLDELSDEELKTTLQNAKDVGVEKFITIGAEKSEFEKVVQLAEENENIYFALGIHPYIEDDFNQNSYDLIEKYASHKKCVGIGESGLDYSSKVSKEKQKQNFIEHIRISEKFKLPLIIHNRDSDHDLMEIMNREYHGEYKVIIHCFSGSIELAKWAIEKGFYLSFSGILTFKNGKNVQEAALICPLDKMLIETDAPYLAPEPYRGKKCEPAYVVKTFEKLAELKDISLSDLEKQLEDNFHTVFDK